MLTTLTARVLALVRAIRDGDSKLLIQADGTGAELYDLAHDRNEAHNLATVQPTITQRLSTQALKWRKSLK